MKKAYFGLDCHIDALLAYQTEFFSDLKQCAPLHCTIKFLDHVSDDDISRIISLAKKVRAPTCTLYTEKLGTFGNTEATRLLMLHVKKTKELDQLHQKIDNALSSMYELDTRFNPHITIARSSKKVSVSDYPSLAALRIPAKQFHLYVKDPAVEKKYSIAASFKLN